MAHSEREPGANADESLRGRVGSVVFSTAGMAPEERFERFRAHVDDLNAIAIDRPDRDRFEARSACWGLGAMLFTHNRTPAMSLSRSRAQAARDGFDHMIVRVMRSGVSFTAAGDATYAAPAASVVIDDLSAPYRSEFRAAEWITLNVSRSADPQLCAGLEARGVGPVGGVGATLLADFMRSLADCLPDADPREESMLAQTSRAMIAGCLLADAAPRLVTATDRSQVARAAVERVIRRNISSARLDGERIAALAGVSRSTLTRLFRREGGVATYLQSLRLELVAAELRDPSRAGESVAALAARWGLHCPASFSRAFRKTYDCTPSDARAGALVGARGRSASPEPRDRATTLAALLAAKPVAIGRRNG